MNETNKKDNFANVIACYALKFLWYQLGGTYTNKLAIQRLKESNTQQQESCLTYVVSISSKGDADFEKKTSIFWYTSTYIPSLSSALSSKLHSSNSAISGGKKSQHHNQISLDPSDNLFLSNVFSSSLCLDDKSNRFCTPSQLHWFVRRDKKSHTGQDGCHKESYSVVQYAAINLYWRSSLLSQHQCVTLVILHGLYWYLE